MKIHRFFDSVYHDNALRQARKRAFWGDLARYLGNKSLRPLEERLVRRFRTTEQPIVFIVGVPRSGTTLLFQLMARHLPVGFVNNFMARFWMAPIVGGMVYRYLHGERESSIPLKSRLGATPGPDSPHEFSWFWEYWAEFGDRDEYTRDELAQMNWSAIRRELEGLAGWFGRPLVLKSINYVNYHIPWIAERFPSARFLRIRRSATHVAQSIYESREKRYDDPSIWWSVRPADVDQWLDEPAARQIAHQINHIDDAVEEGLGVVDDSRQMTTWYEDLTGNPVRTLASVGSLLGVDVEHATALEKLGLSPRNRQRLPDETFEKLALALAETS